MTEQGKPVQDDAVREVHGCRCREVDSERGRVIEAIEGEQYLSLVVGHNAVALTPWQARYLAAKLYRLSRRVKQRTDVPALTQQMEGRDG